jgi:hypothetical protein
MYAVNKENKNIFDLVFNVSLVAVNNQLFLFIKIHAYFIVVSVCVSFVCPVLIRTETRDYFHKNCFSTVGHQNFIIFNILQAIIVS